MNCVPSTVLSAAEREIERSDAHGQRVYRLASVFQHTVRALSRAHTAYDTDDDECAAIVNGVAFGRQPVLPAVCALLTSENPPMLLLSVALVAQACESRGGRKALCELPPAQGALLELSELLLHDEPRVRSHVVRAAVCLSADRTTYKSILRTPAVQAVLDLIATARADEPAARTAPSPTGSELQQCMQLLSNLVQHDRELLTLFSDHPAVEDLGPPESWGK